MITGEKKFFASLDKILLIAILLMLVLGLFVLYSASREYSSQTIVLRQIFWIVFGLVVLFGILRIDYQKFINISYLLYGINLLFLILVLFVGKTKGGSHRWIDLGIFNIQPSELAKITIVLTISSYIGSRRNSIRDIRTMVGVFLLMIPFFFLILIEPDLGGALILLPIVFAMLYIGGAQLKHLLGVVLLGLGSLPILWTFLRDYQKQRLFVFLNPNIDPLGSGYTIIQSKIAVGSGGLFGKGWLSGTQNQLNFLPERHTDFIFSVVGEEWGFIGAMFIILLYAVIILRAVKIISSTPDAQGKLVATGFIALFAAQVIINIGMTIGFSPIVGLTLPLVSYGGSSLVITMVSMAFLLNISMRRSLF